MADGKAGGRTGDGLLLVGLSLYAVMVGYLVRIPCRVTEWGMTDRFPDLCRTAVAQPGSVPAGEQPVLISMISTVLTWFTNNLAAAFGRTADAENFFDLSIVLLAVVWVAVVAVVAALSGPRRTDAYVMALSPVVVLVGFSSWQLWGVLFMMLALMFYVRGSAPAAGAFTALGTSVAVLPFLVLLALVVLAVRHRYLRDLLGALITGVLVWLIVNGPSMVTSWDQWQAQLRGMLRPGTGESSIWSQWEVFQRFPFFDPERSTEYMWITLVLAFVVILMIGVLAQREPSIVQITFLMLAVFVLLNRDYSLGYVIWLVPLVMLCRRNWVEFALWQAVEVLYWIAVSLPGQMVPVLPGSGLFGMDQLELLTAVRFLFLVYFVVMVTVDIFVGKKAAQIGVAPVKQSAG